MGRFLIQSENELIDVFDKSLKPASLVGFDTETNGLHHIRDRVVGFSLAAGNNAWYVPVGHRVNNAITVAQATEFFKWLLQFKVPITMHNALFDTSMVYRTFSVVLKALHDTEAMAYVCGEESHGLKSLAYKYFMYQMTEWAELMAKEFGRTWKSDGKRFGDLDPVRAYEYASDDAQYSLLLVPKLLEKVEELKCRFVYDMEMLMIEPTMRMNFTGVKVDTGLLHNAALQFVQSNLALEQAIYAQAGRKVSIGSPKDVASLLFNELHLPVKKRSKQTGQPSTDAEVMEELQNEHPVVPMIAKYRVNTKLCSAYAEKIPASVESNGRIYPAFHSIGSVSGRSTSSSAEANDGVKYGMNFQNVALNEFEVEQQVPYRIPSGINMIDCQGKSSVDLAKMGCSITTIQDPQAKLLDVRFEADVRRAFLPEDGYLWGKADFSQVEYRIMASLSGEPMLIEGFRKGIDYHSQTASIMLGIPLDKITKEDRKKGKILNFALSYGMAVRTLAKRIGISEADAQARYDNYFAQLPSLTKLIASTKAYASQKGLIKTFFGRVRYFPFDETPKQYHDSLLRAAFNTLIQGTAADVLKIATIRVNARIKQFGSKVKMLLTVHDELCFEIHESVLDEAAAVIIQAMNLPVHSSWAPLITDIQVGRSWSPKDLQEHIIKNPLPQDQFTSWQDLLKV